MKKVVFFFTVVCVSAFSLVSVSLAQEKDGKNFEERRAEIENKLKDRLEKRCENIENKIAERISKFDEGKVRRVNAYENIETRISNLIEKASEKGYDTAQLEEDLTSLSDKVDGFSADYKEYITQLKVTQDYACGESAGDFKSALSDAKDKLKTVRDDAQAIKDFVKTTIKQDITDLKAQKEASDKSEENSETESE